MATATRPQAAGPADPKVQAPATTDPEPSGTTSAKNLRVVFVLGGPGSGKGTQCTKIAENFGFVHLSVGDLLRAEQNSGSKYGEMLKSMMEEGKLVPSELVVKLIQKAMEESPNNKFLIDGFPRNNENHEVFERMTGISPEFVLFFECSEEEMERRILCRCQGRADDNIETIRKRLKVFLESTLPIVKYYEAIGKLYKIPGMRPIEDVFESIRPLFEPFVKEDLLQATVELLKGLDTGDYKIYQRYCHPRVTVFEPQSQGQLVEGVDLRNFKLNLGQATDRLSLSQNLRSKVVAPKVSLLGIGVGLVLYTRLRQKPGNPEVGYVEAYNETGVWQRLKNDDGGLDWKLVHYHRSVAPTAQNQSF